MSHLLYMYISPAGRGAPPRGRACQRAPHPTLFLSSLITMYFLLLLRRFPTLNSVSYSAFYLHVITIYDFTTIFPVRLLLLASWFFTLFIPNCAGVRTALSTRAHS